MPSRVAKRAIKIRNEKGANGTYRAHVGVLFTRRPGRNVQARTSTLAQHVRPRLTTGASRPVSARNCCSRPGLGKLRASKTNPPPLPDSSVGMEWWKEKLKMWTTRPAAGAARCRPCRPSRSPGSPPAGRSGRRGPRRRGGCGRPCRAPGPAGADGPSGRSAGPGRRARTARGDA